MGGRHQISPEVGLRKLRTIVRKNSRYRGKPSTPPPGVQDLADLFVAIRQRPYAMLLLSGGDLDCAGYSIMGWDPFLVLRSQRATRLVCKRDRDSRSAGAIPFTVLEDLLGALELPGETPLPPLAAGGLGFLAYDLKNHLEKLPHNRGG